jgi:hypothetical protein
MQEALDDIRRGIRRFFRAAEQAGFGEKTAELFLAMGMPEARKMLRPTKPKGSHDPGGDLALMTAWQIWGSQNPGRAGKAEKLKFGRWYRTWSGKTTVEPGSIVRKLDRLLSVKGIKPISAPAQQAKPARLRAGRRSGAPA